MYMQIAVECIMWMHFDGSNFGSINSLQMEPQNMFISNSIVPKIKPFHIVHLSYIYAYHYHMIQKSVSQQVFF